MLEDVVARFATVAPTADSWSVRVVRDRSRGLMVRQDVLEPVTTTEDCGAMVTVTLGEGSGYAATCDLSPGGLERAGAAALRWARASRGRSVTAAAPPCRARGEYRSPASVAWNVSDLQEMILSLRTACRGLARGPAIVDRIAAVDQRESEVLIASSAGGAVHQRFAFIQPYLSATANQGGESQTRSFGRDEARQGGLEQLQVLAFAEVPRRIAEEALELLAAPDCPTGTMAVVLEPSQMVLQIHESIGHPLELDRILGDERNYAGSSFVTREMFGSYRYGSPLLNITFDPGQDTEVASYGFDDDGTPAERAYLIKDGILVRGLGGILSQARSHLPGTANARACSWNRPPIDRMANLNLEPGRLSLEQLVAGVERGILMETNRSWSIDDHRNKFQFGCERARLIHDGQLGAVVKNANYRGVSATFWRNLDGVGNQVHVAGTPNCGKGEPNQQIHVGHATPACRFHDVDVFGGG